MSTDKKIIFVYNADSGIFNLLSDIAKKAFQEDGTCSLCMLTHDTLSVKKEWKQFVDTLPHPAIFLHKDEFKTQYPDVVATTFPVIYLETDGTLKEIVSTETIDSASELGALKDTINNALA